MKIVDKLYIYKGQYGYSTLIKNQDDKLYIQVQFKKNNEPTQDKVQIDIKDGFVSFYKTNTGLAKIKYVVLDYEIVEAQGDAYEDPFVNSVEVSDDGLPF